MVVPPVPLLTKAFMKNPFRPTAGATPPEVIGRTGLLDEFSHSLGMDAGAPALLIVGGRGCGKTVMLSQAEAIAGSRGWCVIAETATAGFADRITEHARRLSSPGSAGLVITVDEMHAAGPADMARLGTAVRGFAADGRPVRVVAAGLPADVADLLEDDSADFLYRAGWIGLRAVAVTDVEKSFARAFAAAGFDPAPGDIRRAAAATAGYPFLVQAVGYFIWREAEEGHGALTAGSVDRGIERALGMHTKAVIGSALAEVTEPGMEFLNAMAADDGPSTREDLGRRLDITADEVLSYGFRLRAAGLLEPAEQGRIDFAIPWLREHLRRTAQD